MSRTLFRAVEVFGCSLLSYRNNKKKKCTCVCLIPPHYYRDTTDLNADSIEVSKKGSCVKCAKRLLFCPFVGGVNDYSA